MRIIFHLDLDTFFVSVERILDPSLKDKPVIVGGESGPKARPMKEEWAINIKIQCDNMKTPFFFKQWGTWGADMIKRNKKANGRFLQGKIWEAYPKVA